MKKVFLTLILIITINNIFGQAQYLSNAVNTRVSVANPPVLIGADAAPIGTFRVYLKDDIRWETYNINGFNTQVSTIGNALYKPISYTPSSLEISTALGFTPYSSTNPNGYISSYTEIDPIWIGDKPNYRTKIQNDVLYEPVFPKNTGFNKNFGTTVGTVVEGNDTRVNNGQTAFTWGNHASAGYLTSALAISTYQPIGSYVTPTSTDTFTNKSGNISQWNNNVGYLTSFTESDPLFDTKLATKTTTNLTEGSNQYYTNARARASITLTTIGNGAPTYNNTTGVLSIPTPELPDYTNTGVTAGGAGNVVFYITNDKTSTGTALYTNITYVNPIINDSNVNYTYGWSYNSTTKALTVNVKSATGIFVSLLNLTLLGAPANVANGTSVLILVKGN